MQAWGYGHKRVNHGQGEYARDEDGDRFCAVHVNTMNLSHYHPMDPNMDRGDRQKCVEACSNTLPTHHQTTVFLLEPGKRPLCLEPRGHFFDGSPTVFLRLPDPLRELCPDPALPYRLTECFRSIPFIRHEDLEAFAGATPLACVDLDVIKQRQHLGTLIPVGRRGPVRSRHTAPVREAVDEDPFAFPPMGDALAATLPRGKKRHQRRHTPNESSLFPLRHRESAIAWQPTCHPPASVAASDASHSSTPIGVHTGHHTSGTR
jgi:hypothetical protein